MSTRVTAPTRTAAEGLVDWAWRLCLADVLAAVVDLVGRHLLDGFGTAVLRGDAQDAAAESNTPTTTADQLTPLRRRQEMVRPLSLDGRSPPLVSGNVIAIAFSFARMIDLARILDLGSRNDPSGGLAGHRLRRR